MTETRITPGLRMPPGPRLPRALQTAGFMLGGPRFLEACRRRYGDAVPFGTLFDNQFVMVFHPSLLNHLSHARRTPQRECGDRLGAIGEPMARPRGLMLLYMLTRVGGDRAAAGRFEQSRRAVDEILFDEIVRRRADPELESRDDVFSALLLAED